MKTQNVYGGETDSYLWKMSCNSIYHICYLVIFFYKNSPEKILALHKKQMDTISGYITSLNFPLKTRKDYLQIQPPEQPIWNWLLGKIWRIYIRVSDILRYSPCSLSMVVTNLRFIGYSSFWNSKGESVRFLGILETKTSCFSLNTRQLSQWHVEGNCLIILSFL